MARPALIMVNCPEVRIMDYGSCACHTVDAKLWLCSSRVLLSVWSLTGSLCHLGNYWKCKLSRPAKADSIETGPASQILTSSHHHLAQARQAHAIP